MLNAVNLSFIAFGHFLGSADGQIIVFFVITVAAAEATVGLALVIALFRHVETLNPDAFTASERVAAAMLFWIPLLPLIGFLINSLGARRLPPTAVWGHCLPHDGGGVRCIGRSRTRARVAAGRIS